MGLWTNILFRNSPIYMDSYYFDADLYYLGYLYFVGRLADDTFLLVCMLNLHICIYIDLFAACIWGVAGKGEGEGG